MDDRIEIPTSDPSDTEPAPSPRSPGSKRIVAIAAVVLLVAVAFGTTLQGPSATEESSSQSDLLSPERIERSGFDEYVVLPGDGFVSALVSLDDSLLAFVTGVHGTAVWQDGGPNAAWRIVDGLPGITVRDAAVWRGRLVVVGLRSSGQPYVAVGSPGEMAPIDVSIASVELPAGVANVDDDLFLLTAFGTPETWPSAASVYRFDGERVTPVDVPGLDAAVTRLSEVGDRVLASGVIDGRPAVWEVRDGVFTETPFDPGVDGVALDVGLLPDGSSVVLYTDRTDPGIPGRLVSPLDPSEGGAVRLSYDGLQLLPVGETLVGLPNGSPSVLTTTDGVDWLRLDTTLGGDVGDSNRLLVDVGIEAAGELVIAGRSRSGPVLAGLGVGGDVVIPDGPWDLVDSIDPSITIASFGGLQVATIDDVAVVRSGFRDAWQQPVFADEPSVGSVTEVAQLPCGHLLLASRPYGAVWFSDTGDAWDLVFRDATHLVSDGERAFVEQIGSGVPRVSSVGCVGSSSQQLELPDQARLVGWTEPLGLLARSDRQMFRLSGELWEAIPVPDDRPILSAIVTDENVAIRQADGWHRWSPSSSRFVQLNAPSGVDGAFFEAFEQLVFGSGSSAWVTTDFTTWTELSLGIWNGIDVSQTLRLWVDPHRVYLAGLRDQPSAAPDVQIYVRDR